MGLFALRVKNMPEELEYQANKPITQVNTTLEKQLNPEADEAVKIPTFG